LAPTLSDAGVRDVPVLVAALLHDIEDTDTTYDDIGGEFGETIARRVAEVTDVKFLETTTSKKPQVARAGRFLRFQKRTESESRPR
jgi:(p)ppGpp synthase/HD superfamily hydrolase